MASPGVATAPFPAVPPRSTRPEVGCHMLRTSSLLTRAWTSALGGIVIALALLCTTPAAPVSARPDSAELALGDKIYGDMVDNGYVLPKSPEAKLLAVVAKELKAVGDPLYGAPFAFYVNKSAVPNAFYIFGPRIYVNRGLIRLADSREELGGVLCHEMSHALHRDGSGDSAKLVAYDDRTKHLVARLQALSHGHFVAAIGDLSHAGESFLWLKHSRDEEERADLAGADLCARANINPWGMVWMFQKLGRVTPHGLSLFSDHPNMSKRIALLKKHFKANPQTFARFKADELSATPLWLGVLH
jgi:predicted Zn-dependent protease